MSLTIYEFLPPYLIREPHNPDQIISSPISILSYCSFVINSRKGDFVIAEWRDVIWKPLNLQNQVDKAVTRCFSNLEKISNFMGSSEIQTTSANKARVVAKIDSLSASGPCYMRTETLETIIFPKQDSAVFHAFQDNLDIVATLISHSIIDATANFVSKGQSGSLRVHFSSVFTVMNKKNWLIGNGLIKADPQMALYSMQAPGSAYNHPFLGKDPQISHMKNFQNKEAIHINAGIPNHAFYLAVQAEGGSSDGTIGKIWYQALVNSSSHEDFIGFATHTVQAAKKYGPKAHNIVGQAWQNVGVQPHNFKIQKDSTLTVLGVSFVFVVMTSFYLQNH